jgi:hypothetical protein
MGGMGQIPVETSIYDLIAHRDAWFGTRVCDLMISPQCRCPVAQTCLLVLYFYEKPCWQVPWLLAYVMSD